MASKIVWAALAIIALTGLRASAQTGGGTYVCQGVNCPQVINGLSISGTTFAGGAPSGTAIGTLTTLLSPAAPGFSGTYTLGGPNASSFQIVGGVLETNGIVANGTYNITIAPTQPNTVNGSFGPIAYQIVGTGTPTITSLTLFVGSFTGGAADGTTIGNIAVTTSDSSTPTLSLSGTQTGSGNDKDSFRLSGTTVMTNTAGGATDQPGQYSICGVASGAYSNSPQQSCQTISATGPGGAGWQLTFSDEFYVPKGPSGAYMLNWQNQQTPTSITWGNGGGFCAAGCAQVVLSSPSGWSPNLRAGNTVSLVGATNTGSGAINSNFVVRSVTDDQHFLIYMPGTSAVWGTLGVAGATIGTGPWVAAIVNSTGAPQSNPVMGYTNNASEGWAPENDTVGASGLSILTQNTAYTSADGISHTYKSGHIATWNGNAGFAQLPGWAIDFYGKATVAGGANSGIWPTWWSLGSDNSWPGTGSGGGEVDEAEFAAGTCNLSAYDFQGFGNGGSQTGFRSSPTGTYIGTSHQFTTTLISGALNWFLDGASIFTFNGYAPTDAFYPMIDTEFPSTCASVPSALPLTMQTTYSRVYKRVASGACYSSIPGHATVPHTGAC